MLGDRFLPRRTIEALSDLDLIFDALHLRHAVLQSPMAKNMTTIELARLGNLALTLRAVVQKLEAAYGSAILWVASLAITLFGFCRSNPFYLPMFDDSAIIMRYLTNFQKGCYFCYNIHDGPVYGVSDFWHGLAAGLLSYMGLAPQAALITVSFIGCFLFVRTVFSIFLQISGSAVIALIAGFALYFSGYFLQKAMFIGLETPLNLWLVSATFLCFFRKNQIAFFLFAAASVISKLDTIALISGLIILNLIRAHRGNELKEAAKKALLFFVVPLSIWIGLAREWFVIPIPQSFLSKMFFRPKAPETSWFPFLEPMVGNSTLRLSMCLGAVSLALAAVLAIYRRSLFLPSFVFAAACIGTFGLYFVYNPGEKMPWYYALPEFLLLMSVVSLPIDLRRIQFKPLAIPAALIASGLAVTVLILRFPFGVNSYAENAGWQAIFEQERMESGELANKVVPSNNRVMWTGHGYPAYEFDGYVVDYSGLNFPGVWKAIHEVKNPDTATTDYFKDVGLSEAGISTKSEYILMRDFNPGVFVGHGIFGVPLQKRFNMRLMGSFYAMDLIGVPTFRVFIADPNHPQLNDQIQISDIKAKGKDAVSASGSNLSFQIPGDTSRLLFGVAVGPAAFQVTASGPSGILGRCDIPSIAETGKPMAVHACEIALFPNSVGAPYPVTLTHTGAGNMRVFEPDAQIELAAHH